jgi:hypothetical protein
VIVVFSADFSPSTGELGELEKVVAIDAEGDVILPPSRR